MQLLCPSNKIFIREKRGCKEAYVNSQTLARFFYHILEIPKSDQPMRVPSWVFKSPLSIQIAYLQEVYDMEGTILKSLREIRLITKDKEFAFDLQNLLAQIGIISTVNTRIGGINMTLQYRLSIYGKANFQKFNIIRFRIPFLKKRYASHAKKYGLLCD